MLANLALFTYGPDLHTYKQTKTTARTCYFFMGESHSHRAKAIGRDMLFSQRLYILRDLSLLDDLSPFAADWVSGSTGAAAQT